MSIELKQAAQMSLEALEEIALAGMSGTGQESEEGMRDWHARQAWKFIGIAARALDPLRTAIQQAAESEPVEISPEFTDTARAALLWVLWHHQGGSSPVGQPIRYALGIGAHDHLNDHQVIEAKRWASITGAQASEFHTHPDPGVPDGWRIEEKGGELIVRKNGFGGYSARKNTESIAEAVLHELALDLLAASPAQKGGE